MNFHDISPIYFCQFGIFLPEDDFMHYIKSKYREMIFILALVFIFIINII